jgi:hypothetical protein
VSFAIDDVTVNLIDTPRGSTVRVRQRASRKALQIGQNPTQRSRAAVWRAAFGKLLREALGQPFEAVAVPAKADKQRCQD